MQSCSDIQVKNQVHTTANGHIDIFTLCIYEMSMCGMRIHRKKRGIRQKFRLLMEDYIILHKDVFR